MPLQVVLIDDQVLFRQGLRLLLLSRDDGFVVTAEAAEASQFIPPLEQAAPDVVVLGATRPGSAGPALAEILRRWPGAKVLVLKTASDEVYVAEALMAGARGCALRSQDAAQIKRALREVASGQMYLAPTLPRSLLEHANRQRGRSPAVPWRLGSLSRREREILGLLALGRTNREVARRLFVSTKTVETHRMNINRKLDVRSAAALVRFAALHGLLPPEPGASNRPDPSVPMQ